MTMSPLLVPMWALLGLLLLAVLKSANASDKQQQCSDKNGECLEDPLFCGVYMAPSTVMESNLGIYTAKNLTMGEVVNFPEIAIPLLFREWGVHPNTSNPDGQLWDRYIWEGSVMNIESKNESNTKQSGSVFVPGVGCTVNSMLDMSNIHSTRGSRYETAGIHRARDASAGSFTPYHGATTKARINIEAGSELFASYGDDWIPWIPGATVSNNETMDKGEEFMESYKKFIGNHQDMPNELKEGLWNFTTQKFPYKSRVLNVFPKTKWENVEKAMNDGEDNIVPNLLAERGKRDLDWLKQHGKCQDHIVPGRSTIRLAGMGAFANRNLPKGTVVGYSPLIHIGKAANNLLKIQYNESGGYTKQDLIINYSFGHPESTLILTPYGAMVNYINHNKTLANVKVQWPKEEDLVAHKPEWLSKDVNFLANTQSKIGLSFDYVALSDIKEGEEIFMDYGDDWEQAWWEHVKNYKPGDANYVHSSQFKHDKVLRTPQELETNPYPPNLHTLCIESYTNKGGKLEFVPKQTKLRVKCRVLEREGNLYTVEMYLSEKVVTVYKVPFPQGIQLVDKVRSGDWHLSTAFRHPIGIPHYVFPENWKNKK